MSSWQERLHAWMLCMCAAVFIGLGAARLDSFIPVRGAELPGRAVEILAERVENWEAHRLPQASGLEFDEPHVLTDSGLTFVTGYFTAEQADLYYSYRYLIVLRKVPFTDWYLYDAGHDSAYSNVSSDALLNTWTESLFFRYGAAVSLTEVHLEKTATRFAWSLGFWLVVLVLGTALQKHGVLTPRQQGWFLTAVWIVFLAAALIWIVLNNPQASFSMFF
ncbi:MAG: hypothetical protein ACI4PV_06165 [Butyricicoccus sp.]